MKKLSTFCLLLCLMLVLQAVAMPVLATETEASAPEATAALPDTTQNSVPDVAFGTAQVSNGCRGLDSTVPVGGDGKLLKSTQAAFVYERNTGTVIYSYNPDMTLSPGALTKILTAIVAIENGKLDSKVTVSTMNYTAISGTRNSALKNEEVMTLEDMLHCMILQLANDAAVSIAEHISGSEAAFVSLMNETARAIGCTDSVFVNSHGLEASGQYTTARDMAKILHYAMNNARFRELFGCKTYTVPETNRTEARELGTLNHLVGTNAMKFNYDGVTGGLGTYAAASGASIVCTAEGEGMSLICVLMGAERTYVGNAVNYYGNYEEIWDLLDYSLEDFKICRVLHSGQAMEQFSVANGENQVVGMNTVDMDTILPRNINLEDLTMKYSVTNGGLKAPVTEGERVSTLQIWCGSSCVAETELFAMSDVRSLDALELEIQNTASRDDSNLGGFLIFIGVVFLIVFLSAAGLIIVRNVRYSIARKKRRRRRQDTGRNRP